LSAAHTDPPPEPTRYRWSTPPPIARPVVGIDAGGTFTDFVAIDREGLTFLKVPSVPDAPERAVVAGLSALALNDTPGLALVHGSTVATNALLERRGADTVFVTNSGFEDLLALGRQARSALYDLTPAPRMPLVAGRGVGVDVRRSADGGIVTPLAPTSLDALVDTLRARRPEAIAVSLLFSYLAPDDERAIVARLRAALPGTFVTAASDVVPEQREFERGMTTWVNAYLGPKVAGYLERLRAAVEVRAISIMQSAAVAVDLEEAASTPVRMLLSGPAGGLIAARRLARDTGHERLLTFDMGGTSTDVGLVDRGFTVTSDTQLDDVPLAVPAVDMHTIGAGGGSIVYLDDGGGLQVGPRSAGALPGPVAYGRGGVEPTVTDANLVLGRLPAGATLGGIRLDEKAARAAFANLAKRLGLERPEAAAAAAIALVDAKMVAALRVMSVQRGVDPRELTLVAFGGAGGLHVTALAEALGAARALVPVHAGALSALGMVLAPPGRELSQSVLAPLEAAEASRIDRLAATLSRRARDALTSTGIASGTLVDEVRVEVRYQGQSATIAVPWEGDAERAARAFDARHAARFGHAFERAREAALVRVRVTAPPAFEGRLPGVSTTPPSGGAATGDTPVVAREALVPGDAAWPGPLVVSDPGGTSYVGEGWQVTRDAGGNVMITRR